MDIPSVFIGSSTEGLQVAEALKDVFGDRADVDIWNSGQVFSRNQSFLSSLIDTASLYEFAVLVFTCDDIATIRGESYQTARDNVLFEYGLFQGKLGPRRTYAYVDKDLRVPTDLVGISLDSFTRESDGEPSAGFNDVAVDIVTRILDFHEHTTEFYHLPSTALAIGYFHNFLTKVCDQLDNFEPLQIDGKEINYQSFKLNILIPDWLELLDDQNLRYILRGLVRVSVNSSLFRDFPFYMQATPDFNEGHLEFFDIPTTMRSSREAIMRIFKEEYIGKSDLRMRAEAREVRNFERTLHLLLKERPIWQKYINFQNLSDYID